MEPEGCTYTRASECRTEELQRDTSIAVTQQRVTWFFVIIHCQLEGELQGREGIAQGLQRWPAHFATDSACDSTLRLDWVGPGHSCLVGAFGRQVASSTRCPSPTSDVGGTSSDLAEAALLPSLRFSQSDDRSLCPLSIFPAQTFVLPGATPSATRQGRS